MILFTITQEYESGPVQSDDPCIGEVIRKTYVQPGFYFAVLLGIAYFGWIIRGISR